MDGGLLATLQSWVGRYFPRTVGKSNGTDDTATIQALLTAARTGGRSKVTGKPGETYKLSAPLVIGSGTTLDVTGCRVQLNAGSNCNMIRNYGYANPAATAADGATTSGSNVVTTALGASAVAGQHLTVAGAGAAGNGILTGIVASATSTTVTLNDLRGQPLLAGATVSSAAVKLINPDTNVAILGGTWDRGGVVGTSIDMVSMALFHIDGLHVDIENYQSTNGKECIYFGACRGFDITVRGGNGYSSPLQGLGPLFGGKTAVYGGVWGDDATAFTCCDWPSIGPPTCGDIYGVRSDVFGADATGTPQGGNLYKVISGAGCRADDMTAGQVTGKCTFNGVYIGDSTAFAQTTGGTYGRITVGLLDCTPGQYPVGIFSPAADRISIGLSDNMNRSGTPLSVNIQGTSTATIDVLELVEPTWNVPSTVAATAHGVYGGAASVTINHLILVRPQVKTTNTSGIVNMVNIATGTVRMITLDNPSRQSSGSTGTDVAVNGVAAIVGHVRIIGGKLTAGSSVVRALSGTLGTVTLAGTLADTYARAIRSDVAGTLNVQLSGPTFTGSAAAHIFLSVAGGVITGYCTISDAQALVQRNAAEAVRVNGSTLPVDVAILTPSAGDVCTNTNASAVYGGANTVVTWDGTSWRADRGYLKVGTATLVAGTVTVADTNITANSVIRLATRTPGGTQGAVFISALTASTSFIITSTSASDTSVVEYEVVRY